MIGKKNSVDTAITVDNGDQPKQDKDSFFPDIILCYMCKGTYLSLGPGKPPWWEQCGYICTTCYKEYGRQGRLFR